MVVLRPFKAIRPRADLAKAVATLPYDVLSSDEARELAVDNAHSFLHIDKAEVDLPASVDVHSHTVYEQARSALSEFLCAGSLLKDPYAQLYLYELTMKGRVQTGIVGTTAIDDYERGLIKRHEYTLPEKERDRIRHFDETSANTSPIFLTYRAEDEIQGIIGDWKASHEPIYDFTSFYDVRHRVFAVNDEVVIARLTVLFAQKVPALYIADGHHRSASAVRVGKERRARYGDKPDAAYNFFLSVIFPDTELEILDYNRVVTTGLPGDFWSRVAEKFDVEPVAKSKPTQTHAIHAFTAADGWQKLTPKATIIPHDEVGALDVSLLQDNVLAPLLGITDPKTSPDIQFVGGIRGLDALEAAVNAGASIAFALYPPTLTELLAVADAGKIMPPKSTWFEPKLLSGLFLHDLRD